MQIFFHTFTELSIFVKKRKPFPLHSLEDEIYNKWNSLFPGNLSRSGSFYENDMDDNKYYERIDESMKEFPVLFQLFHGVKIRSYEEKHRDNEREHTDEKKGNTEDRCPKSSIYEIMKYPSHGKILQSMNERDHTHEDTQFFSPGYEFFRKRLMEYFCEDGDKKEDPEQFQCYSARIFDRYKIRKE